MLQPPTDRAASFSLPAVLALAASAIFAGVYLFVDFNKLCALRMGSNTGEYLQAAIRFMHTGSTFNYVDWNSTLAMHDQWMFLAVAPLAAIWPRPEVVVAFQVLALAAAAPILYLLVRELKGGRLTALLVAVIYLISPSVQGFANAEFVPLDFVPLLASLLVLCALRGWFAGALVCAQLLCGTKEDVAMFLVWFGGLYAVFRDRRLGGAIAVLAALNLAIYFGTLAAFGKHIVHPTYGLDDYNWPKQLAFTLEILAPFAFAPLALGWRVLLVVPIVAELFLAHWAFPLYQAGSYYTIPFVTIVCIAAAYVLATRPVWARVAMGLAVVMALFFNTTVLHFGRHLYTCDPLYPVAKAWGMSNVMVDFPCEDQGAWTIAAANIQARLQNCGQSHQLTRARGTWTNEPLASDAPWTAGPGR